MGKIVWEPSRVQLHLSSAKHIDGIMLLRDKLKDKQVMNATVLDWLLKNQTFIPNAWKSDREIYFCGTVYRFHDSYPIVRGLYWSSKTWVRCSNRLDDRWDPHSPVVIYMP